jgi:O-antigen/teichoic acid export membrane protein
MSLKKQFVSSSLWSVTAAVFNNLASLLTFAILARFLTPVEFGTVALALVFIALSRVFVIAGIPDALIRKDTWSDSFASTAFWTNAALGLVIAGILSLGAAPILYHQYDRTFGLVLAALSATLLVEGSTTVHIAKLRREFKHKELARREIASNIVSSIIGVSLALNGWGVWAMVASRAVAVSLTSLILWRASQFRPLRHYSRTELSEISRFSSGILGSQLLNQAGTQIPVILLGGLIGPAAVGQYRVGARSLELIISLFIVPIQSAAVSVLSRFAADPNEIARSYIRLTRGCAALSCPVILGVGAVAPDFVFIAFGPQWHDAGYVLIAMCLIAGPATLGYFEAPTMNAAGRSDLTFLTSLAGSVGNIVCGLIGLAFGAVGVAAALTIRAHLTMPFALALIRSAVGVKPMEAVSNIAPALLSAVLMFTAITIMRLWIVDDLPTALRLGVCILTGAIVYVFALMTIFRDWTVRVAQEFAPLVPKRLLSKVGLANE